ncbi:hypothetical protein SGODD07_01365 [Streptococcus gordonii]|uniref:Uncharacterized protein n=1 Tax=Streptococcus gordonii TaxID=1302 RepID=A0A139N5W9_STRGN|nr:hypothetical protein SGODD07_01365 [Streptococcus gordonii]
MGCLILDLFLIFPLFKAEARSHEGSMEDHVNFIEGQPVFDQTLVASKKCAAETLVKFQHATIPPTTILLNQVHGTVKVSNGHQGLNAILMAFLKEVFVKFQASFIGLQLIPLRENPAPSNGQTIGFKAHLAKEGNVLLEAMVHINGFLGRVEIAVLKVKHLFLTSDDGQTVLTNRHHIYVSQPATIRIISALTLVGSCRSAPQEAIRKSQFFSHISTRFLICLFIYLYYSSFCKLFLIK